MPIEVTLPELGENLEDGEVLAVKVAVGDVVAEGQTLVEVEAEKSTADVPAPQAGKIVEVRVKKGEKLKVGQTICLLEPAGAPVAAAAKATPSPSTKSAPAAEPPPVAPAESAKGNGEAAPKTQREPPPKQPVAEAPPSSGDKLVPAGPATRRLARELGVDLHQVPGSGKSGHVSQEDVKEYVRQLAAGTALSRQDAGPTAAPPLPDFQKWGPVERQGLEPIRRKTAEHMSLAWRLIPHVTQHDQADITDLDAFRRSQEGSGPKLTVTAFALKAAAVALREFPQFNSSLDAAAGQLVVKKYYHLGVAVDTPRGLLVPVLRDVERKSIKHLAQELADIAERARQNKITVEEMRGATFTITNLGGIGGTAFTPIINYPEVAILGLSRGRLQPVVHNGQVTPRLLLPLSLSYDHRVIDGAAAARFTRRIAILLESPLQLLLEV